MDSTDKSTSTTDNTKKRPHVNFNIIPEIYRRTLKFKQSKSKQDKKSPNSEDKNDDDEEINDIENKIIQKYIRRRIRPAIRHFKKDWMKTRKYEQILQYIIIVAGALIPIVNVSGFINSP
jgi:hypothetical protein